MKQRAVCVLGMHRSGTSAITSLLEPIGVHLGTIDDLRDDAAGDPHGYWEHRGLKAVSEDLLHRLGADWHRPPILGEGWQDALSLDDLRAHARRVIAAHAAAHPLWGWKDPRMSLTLPFWTPLLPDVRYVVCLRHPLDAARSLETRDALPLWHGLRLWLHYTASALVGTAGEPRLLLFYEDALADPVAAMEAIAAFLDRPAPSADEAMRRLTPDRRHERAALRDTGLGAGTAPIGADADSWHVDSWHVDSLGSDCPDAVRILHAALRAVIGPRGLRTASAGRVLDATAAAALVAQRADDRADGLAWQASAPALESAPAGASALADAWQRVRLGIAPR